MKLIDAVNLIKEQDNDEVRGYYTKYGVVLDNTTQRKAMVFYEY